ncbi:hypothetical protein PYW08_005245 [Mythimna loreyi]|uniref:Uncharacterized protein n=1 Tax=Mythimna loreyi TaxID=667449 RepID=A0ACC2QGZ7_9NEOP|nr:hypothetical protein PYW08_005245 [Mythimna loreyi]
MLQLPTFYKHYDRTPLDSVYKALRNKDFADCVLQATRALEQSNSWVEFKHKEKSASESIELGIHGKEAFSNGDYQMALMKYNMALMRAPPGSDAMRLSYYSRAELLLKTEQFQACVKDVDTCLALNCSDDMALKLRQMKKVASRGAVIEQKAPKRPFNPFTEELFKLKGARNPDIPCATSYVEVNMVSGLPKVVAARDIPGGTVVAVETAFVGVTHPMNHVTSCHYCHKMDLNLMPCEGCCSAMFCDKQCEENSIQDGHNFECKIMNMIVDDIKLPVKATLKIRQLCNSWDEFITASNELGIERMENSSIAEIFGPHKFSLLNSHYDTHFIYGALFNRCMYIANIIHYLDIHTSFLPDSPEEKSAAIRAVSRVMMHLALHCTPVVLQHFTDLCTLDRLIFHKHPNKGYFPFIGNLPHSCVPNTYVAGLRNSAALITITPVKKGAELSISYLGHWLQLVPTALLYRPIKIFVHFRAVCKDCIVCSGRADNISLNSHLTDTQQKAFKKFMTYASSMVFVCLRNRWELIKLLIMTNYVFYYFDGKGLGESCRLLLAYGGQEFEDRRVTIEEWPALKPKCLFGKIPILEIDGKQYAQSLAISRYLGRKYGLVGDTPEDALEIDQNVDLVNDIRAKAAEVQYESNEVVKESKYADYAKNAFPNLLERLNAVVVQNNGHLALGKLTWGDFVLAGILDYLKYMLRMPDLEKTYPVFQKVIDNVYSSPKVKAYSESKN